MEAIERFIALFNNNKYVIFAVSVAGLIGFCMTLYLMHKTRNIEKIMKRLEVAKNYNDARESYRQKFDAFRLSITKDKVKNRTLVSDLRLVLAEYKAQFSPIFKLNEHILIFKLSIVLKTKYEKLNWLYICFCLEKIMGRLSKKESTKYEK